MQFHGNVYTKWTDSFDDMPLCHLSDFFVITQALESTKQEKTLKNLNYLNCTIYRVISFCLWLQIIALSQSFRD